MREEIPLIVVLAQKTDTWWKPVGGNRETHKSCGERPRVDGCSGRGRAAHLVNHELCTIHMQGKFCESRSLIGYNS